MPCCVLSLCLTCPVFRVVCVRACLLISRLFCFCCRLIFKRYAKRLLVVDVVAVFPFQVLAPSADLSFTSTCVPAVGSARVSPIQPTFFCLFVARFVEAASSTAVRTSHVENGCVCCGARVSNRAASAGLRAAGSLPRVCLVLPELSPVIGTLCSTVLVWVKRGSDLAACVAGLVSSSVPLLSRCRMD